MFQFIKTLCHALQWKKSSPLSRMIKDFVLERKKANTEPTKAKRRGKGAAFPLPEVFKKPLKYAFYVPKNKKVYINALGLLKSATIYVKHNWFLLLMVQRKKYSYFLRCLTSERKQAFSFLKCRLLSLPFIVHSNYKSIWSGQKIKVVGIPKVCRIFTLLANFVTSDQWFQWTFNVF